MRQRFSFGKKHFLYTFAAVVFVLALVKWIWIVPGSKPAVEPKPVAALRIDSIVWRSAANDTLVSDRRNRVRLVGTDGKPVRNRIMSVSSYRDCFPDLNDVQLATAQRLGVRPVKDRDEAARNKEGLVYVGDNPFSTCNRYRIRYLISFRVRRTS